MQLADGKYNIFKVPFESIPPVTITATAKLQGVVDVHSIFFLFQVRKLPGFDIQSLTSREKPYTSGIDGNILGMKYSNMKRGIILRDKYFNNSILMDIEYQGKYLNVHISNNTLLFTGCKNMENPTGVTKLVIDHINRAARLYWWIVNGEEDTVYGRYYVKDLLKYFIELGWVLPSVVFTDAARVQLCSILLNDFYQLATEYFTVNDQLMLLNLIPTLKPVFEGSTSDTSSTFSNTYEVRCDMYNINCCIGFRIPKLIDLAIFIRKYGQAAAEKHDIENAFRTLIFDELLHTDVAAKLKYDPIALGYKTDKLKQHISFTIKQSGNVFISGPEVDTMRLGFNAFVKMIREYYTQLYYNYGRPLCDTSTENNSGGVVAETLGEIAASQHR